MIRNAAPARRVVIVDDHPDVADIVCMLFSALGHDCRGETSGERGLRTIESFLPDIVILDIGLPDISGYEMARRLRARWGRSLYLVAMTGWGQPEDRERAFAAGFDMHVLKPANAALLSDVVSRATRASEPLRAGVSVSRTG